MKSTIETSDCMNDLLLDSRHFISKGFLQEARTRGLKLIDENVVIFSHQEVTMVAAPFDLDEKEYNRNQSLIYMYFKGTTGALMEDGFYTIQGNLDKNGINEKNLLMLNSEGKVVQKVEVDHIDDEDGPSEAYDRNGIEVTDSHFKRKKKATVCKVSGTVNGRPFVYRYKIFWEK